VFLNTNQKGMNLSTPVGRACRRSLPVARNYPSNITPYIPRATFLSLRNNNQPLTSSEDGCRGNQDVASLADQPQGRGRPNARLPLPDRKRIPKATHRSPGDLLESLFEQSVAPPDMVQGWSQGSRSSLEHYKTVEVLRTMLVNGTHPVDSWNFFVENFSPELGIDSRQSLPSYLQSTARQLLRQVIDAKFENPLSRTLPTCTVISTMYVQLGILHEADWVDLMLGLLGAILKIEAGGVRENADKSALFKDVLGSWNAVCTQVSTETPFLDSLVLDWSSIPQLPKRRGNGPWQALTRLTGSLRGRRSDNLGLVAVATFILLVRHCPPNHPSLQESTQFIDALTVVVDTIDDIEAVIMKASPTGSLHSDITKLVKEDWPKLDFASQIAPSQTLISSEGVTASRSIVSREFVGYDISKRIKAASRAHDLAQIDLIWLDAARLPVDTTTQEYKRGFLMCGTI
jgi:hypothetical protein